MRALKISAAAVARRMDSAGEPWKQIAVGTEVVMLECGRVGTITAKIDDCVTGFALYSYSTYTGSTHLAPRALLDRAAKRKGGVA